MLDMALTIEAGFLRGIPKVESDMMRSVLLRMIANA